MSPTSTATPSESRTCAHARLALLRDVVFHQLDDLNALAEALATATRGNDANQVAAVRASMARFAVALDWNAEGALPAILAYAEEHAELDDDFFAPAYILKAIVPEHRETAALLARLHEPLRARLAAASTVPPHP